MPQQLQLFHEGLASTGRKFFFKTKLRQVEYYLKQEESVSLGSVRTRGRQKQSNNNKKKNSRLKLVWLLSLIVIYLCENMRGQCEFISHP